MLLYINKYSNSSKKDKYSRIFFYWIRNVKTCNKQQVTSYYTYYYPLSIAGKHTCNPCSGGEGGLRLSTTNNLNMQGRYFNVFSR